MPPSLFGFLWRVSAANQIAIAALAIVVFALNTAPLEMQRRILNAATLDRDTALVVVLAVAYGCIVLVEGLVKLLMNIYGGWIGEKAVRVLRLSANALVDGMPHELQSARVRGVEVAMVLAEPEDIGGFVGIAISELVLQVGILLSVFGYMFFVQPMLALVCLAIFSPQLVFVPLMQRAINRRVQSRISVLRHVSTAVLQSGTDEAERAWRQRARFTEVFELNLGVIKLRFTMKFLMNLTHNLGRVVVLGVGGWFVVRGRTDIGTVVAFVSGLGNVREPWGELVNWYQDTMLTSAKYRMFVAAMQRFARKEDPLAA
jgi:ABC-type bacteriocin/lantibiotic exporter with double-glycine peptidase domain